MKRIIFTVALIANAIVADAQLSFSGSPLKVITVKPESSTGLEAIYVLPYTQNIEATYAGTDDGSVSWVRYSSGGGAQGETLGSTSSIMLQAGSYGYIVTAGGRQHCYWVVDYSATPYNIESVAVDHDIEADCDRVFLKVEGEAAPIVYYTITGARRILSRDIHVNYATLDWDEGNKNYTSTEATESFESLSGHFSIPSPLVDTPVEVSGDRFLTEWGQEESTVSSTIRTTAVAAHTWTTVAEHTADNEISGSDSGDLSGTAPLEVTFSAVTTDAVRWREWQISKDQEFNIIDLRFNQDDVEYTFNEYGTMYVRFIAANEDGSCQYVSDVYEVRVAESQLLCPNVFSPGNQDGVNDLWKVSYKSIIKYECQIFNRWGVLLFSSDDPAEGWDGKQGGKIVGDGVYFYVIKALGADGHKYNLSGDINVISFSKLNNPSTTE